MKCDLRASLSFLPRGLFRLAGGAVIFCAAILGAAGADQTNAVSMARVETARLMQLVSGTECVGVSVDLDGQVLWAGAPQREIFLFVAGEVLRVKLDFSRQPSLRVGDLVHLSGQGLAGQGWLNEALADNDGLHALGERSGTIYLGRGWHPFRAECFNGSADYVFEVEYAGPNRARQAIPASALFRKNPTADGQEIWAAGLNYRCFQGAWERLPAWREWLPVKSGVTSDLNLGVRAQDQNVGLEFTGYLKVDEPGDYTFWTKSDDGSRLFIGDNRLRIEIIKTSPLPAPREIRPGQTLAEHEDAFWATMEGLVTGLHVDLAGMARVELSGELGRTYVEVPASGSGSPELFSRFRAVGLCRSVPLAQGGWVAGRLQVMDAGLIQPASTAVDQKPSVTTLAELRQLATSGYRTSASLCLTGMVRCAATPGGLFAFEDETGGVVVQMDAGGKSLLPGERIVIQGIGALDQNRLFLTPAALVDNNGIHLRRERDGAMFLRKGRVPVHLSWFNRSSPFALEVYYQGPGISRQRIPDAALGHPEVGTNGHIKWATGLNYVGYRGDWQSLPKTSEMDPVKIGVVTNFDVRVFNQLDKAGLDFNGFLEVPRDGNYIFTVNSDDGAQLYLEEQIPALQQLDKISMPPPAAIVPRQVLERNRNHFWSQVEGNVNYIHERNGLLYLELGSDYGPMNIEVADSAGVSPLLLLGSRVKLSGYCEGGIMSGGQEIASTLIVPGRREIEVIRADPILWSRYSLQSISAAAQKIFSDRAEAIVRLQGRVTAVQGEKQFRLADESGSILVQSAQTLPASQTNTLEVLGRLVRSDTNIVLCGALLRESAEQANASAKETPVLTKVLPIKQLPREQAQQAVPVKIRGVITLVRGSGTGFIIQDDTAAIDVWWPPHSSTSLPRVGDFWEIEGNTFMEFSPYVRVQRAVRLGAGVMPEPLRPDWDQLLNGSLDTRFVELQGIVTSTSTNSITLFTRSGKINVFLSPLPVEPLVRFQNALVRIRGCVVPIRNEVSQQVQIGQTRLSNVSVGIDEPAPFDPFAAELKRPSELLLFDARAGSLRRVKIAGQILHVRGPELFLADGTNSVRVLLQDAGPARAGDLVEVVGFPELGGPSPVLREAVWRQTGNAPLPAPRVLPGDALFNKGQDGALIVLEARLIGLSGSQSQKVLELQNGNRDFIARVVDTNGSLAGLVNGSRLRLSGVYAEERGRAAGQTLAAFELLINSPMDISVLEQPPWWTPRRVLLATGALLLALLVGAFWIVLLHRRVEEASAKLATEVRRREKIQQQNMLEKERTRIAKDMHDQLGTNVTQVGLLAELTKRDMNDAGKTAQHADQICRRAIELGQTLDAIVWAVNPKNDSLDKFCDYMAVHAQELFQLTDVLCRVDLPPEMPDFPLTAEVRHHLFLATKEALNNVVRHAGAKEVWMRFKLSAAEFQLSIADDGRGFAPKEGPSLRNGLVNMQKRLEDIGGRFAVNSQPGRGTEVTFVLPLPPLAEDNPDSVEPVA